jgi:hypothetical protein
LDKKWWNSSAMTTQTIESASKISGTLLNVIKVVIDAKT